MSKTRVHLLILLIICLTPSTVFGLQTSNPILEKEDISIEPIVNLPPEVVRLAYNAANDQLYFNTLDGEIYQLPLFGTQPLLVPNSSNHGLEDVQGFEISTDGIFYLVGNLEDEENATNVGVIKRGTENNGDWTWETVMQTEPYPLSNTAFDHIMNAIVLSPDQSTLYINSGSRTDHGEVHDVNGRYPNLREAPLTAKILQIPADTTNLLLENDIDFLRNGDFIYAEGTRNSFSLAFDANGQLFGVENSGDRDDSEELNKLDYGKHYGFPWEMGGNKTPMQFSGYNPNEDPFIPPNSTAANLGTFYNDPDYPTPPEGVELTSGLLNIGPDADTFRDSLDFQIKDASDLGIGIRSFSSHLSPLGLVFDRNNTIGGEYTGDGFLLGFSGGSPGDPFLLSRMNYHGEDLIHIEFSEIDDELVFSATSIVRGFLNPIDTEIIGNKIYVIEHRNEFWLNVGTTTRLYEITFPLSTTSEDNESERVAKFKLNQNYPNPFNPSTIISLELNQASDVVLEVTDITGRKITRLVDGPLSAQSHQFNFDGSALSSGIYVYALSINGIQVETRKMMLIK